jgi:hypothetical protein
LNLKVSFETKTSNATSFEVPGNDFIEGLYEESMMDSMSEELARVGCKFSTKPHVSEITRQNTVQSQKYLKPIYDSSSRHNCVIKNASVCLNFDKERIRMFEFWAYGCEVGLITCFKFGIHSEKIVLAIMFVASFRLVRGFLFKTRHCPVPRCERATQNETIKA